MIIATGATGQLGRPVVEKLARRVAADRVGASCRDPDRAADLAALGVRVRRGDFAESGGLAAAFAGAEQVLVVSVDKLGETAIGMHRAAVDAARAAGARRVALHQPHGRPRRLAAMLLGMYKAARRGRPRRNRPDAGPVARPAADDDARLSLGEVAGPAAAVAPGSCRRRGGAG